MVSAVCTTAVVLIAWPARPPCDVAGTSTTCGRALAALGPYPTGLTARDAGRLLTDHAALDAAIRLRELGLAPGERLALLEACPRLPSEMRRLAPDRFNDALVRAALGGRSCVTLFGGPRCLDEIVGATPDEIDDYGRWLDAQPTESIRLQCRATPLERGTNARVLRLVRGAARAAAWTRTRIAR